jgi:cleavage and polyadenylation specificity factor subunit 5
MSIVSTLPLSRPECQLQMGQDEKEGLACSLQKRFLRKQEDVAAAPEFEVGELLGTYYRPNFEAHLYPYRPAHIKKPKEYRTIYHVHLPEKRIADHLSS